MKDIKPLIDSLVSLINSSKEFAITQAPDVVRQWIAWGLLEYAGWTIFCASILAVSLWITSKVWKNWDDLQGEEAFFSVIGCLVSVIPSFSGTVACTTTLFQIWIAPKVWLIEHVISLGTSK